MSISRYTNSTVDMSSAPPLLQGFEHINRYWDKQHNIFAAKLLPGEFYVSMHGELITTVLGSCVSACVRDKIMGVGGMNHFMLPDSQERSRSLAWVNTPVSAETRYGNVAMERLINVILASGGKRKNLEVKLFGGGRVLNINTDIGGKNVDFVKQYLQKEGLRIESEDTRGFWPRKVQYFPLTGRVRIKRLNSVHNDTLTRRELEYLKTLKEKKIEGKVDLF
ncbi:MAG: chemoreceptor glutamine deamidase CheD [Gammaproteobacteria bacterium]|jgi:chemotaxis protein CheD|nr:chemoreceptor glutamine deamidase CheD [Gammaproteobacteria bacterium]